MSIRLCSLEAGLAKKPEGGNTTIGGWLKAAKAWEKVALWLMRLLRRDERQRRLVRCCYKASWLDAAKAR